MNTARDNNGQKSAGIWQNLRLVPLFSLIFGGILLLFALCIGVASYFLISGNHSLDDATDEIQVRMGLSNSSNHLRTARLTIIQAGAAARIGEMDEFRANIAAAENGSSRQKMASRFIRHVKLRRPRIWNWMPRCRLASTITLPKA